MRYWSFVLSCLAVIYAHGQFPLDQAITGDTTYTGILPAIPLAAFPVGDGLMIPYSGSHAVSIDVNGSFVFDLELTDVPLATFGVHQSPDAIIYVGKTARQHAFMASWDPSLDGFGWIDSLNTDHETYYSGAVHLSNGDLLACGTAYFSGNDLRPLVKRISATGAPVWFFNPPTGQITRATYGRELPNGDLLITGLNGPPIASQIKVMCQVLGSSGTPIFSSDIGIGGFQQGVRITAAVDGGSLIWGRQDSPINMVVAKVDNDCAASWVRYIGGFHLMDVCVDPNAAAYMVTGIRPGFGALVARVDQNGDTLWTRTYGGSTAVGRSIRPDGFGGFIIAGSVAPSITSGSPVPYLLRIDANGSMTGLEEATGSVTGPILVYPNPSDQGWIIDASGALNDPQTWELDDAAGRTLRRGNFGHGCVLRVENDGLSPGIYYLRIIDRSGVRRSSRLVRQ